MKSVSLAFRQPPSNADEESKHRLKFALLFEDCMEVQKEFVSKKRKMKALELKRNILHTEVRFLRKKHRYLLSVQNQERITEEAFISNKKRAMDHGENNNDVYQGLMNNTYPVLGNGATEGQEEQLTNGDPAQAYLPNKKKGKGYLVIHKELGKSKARLPAQSY